MAMKDQYSQKSSYKMKGKGLQDGTHASPVMKCDVFAAQKRMNKGLVELPSTTRGYPDKALQY